MENKIHNNKKFDRALFNKYDKFGKDIVKKFFKSKGYIAKDNPDIYGIDLILYKKEKKVGYAEVEVKKKWTSVEYPYNIMDIPKRKGKFFKTDLPSYFVMVNNEGTALQYINGQKILQSPIIRKDNCYMKNEPFFRVYVSEVKHVTL